MENQHTKTDKPKSSMLKRENTSSKSDLLGVGVSVRFQRELPSEDIKAYFNEVCKAVLGVISSEKVQVDILVTTPELEE